METLSEAKKVLKLIIVVILIVVVSFLVASYFFAMPLGLALFYFTPGGLAISKLYLVKLPIELFIVIAFTVPVKLNVGVVFAFLWGVYLLCFVAAWNLRESFHKVIENSLSHPICHVLKNWLFAMPIIASMVLNAVVVIYSFQEAHGVPTGEAPLPENPFESFFLLTLAPLMEELGFRITPIGAFLVVYLFWVTKKRAAAEPRIQRLKVFFLAWFYPEKAKKVAGLKTVNDSGIKEGISLGEWIMVILTSATFGLVHYLGGGWEVGKITLVLVQGFAMGLTYLLYGVQAPILLHWFFNYYPYVYSLALDIYPNLSLLVSVINVAMMGLGMLGWAAAIILGVRFVARAIANKIKSSDQNVGSL